MHAHLFGDLGQGDLSDPPFPTQPASGIEDRRFSQALRFGAPRPLESDPLHPVNITQRSCTNKETVLY